MKLTRHYPRYDATLDTDGCSGRSNADLTLTMRMGFKQINPAGGANTGTYHDYGRSSAPSRNIVKWTARDWAAWKVNFCTSAQTFWDGKFWIDNRRGAFAIRQGRDIFIPNAFCRFRLIGSDAASGPQHHVIEVVRLAPTETWFGSHANLYDSRDTDLVAKGRDSAGNAIMQRAHVHEVGHLLRLGHVAIGQPGCPPSGDTNISACYGVTDADKNSVMGGGMRRDTVHGQAWNDAFEAFVRDQPHSSAYTPPAAKNRPSVVVMNRIYPRSVAEFEAGAVLTTPVPGR